MPVDKVLRCLVPYGTVFREFGIKEQSAKGNYLFWLEKERSDDL
jgi:hypothetical protein